MKYRPFFAWALVLVLLETASALTLFHPTAKSVCAAIAGVLVFMLGWKRPTLGLAALMLELLIGSKGHLLQLTIGDQVLALRIVLTISFFLGWSINSVSTGSWKRLPLLCKDRKAYLLLFVAIGYATLRGWVQGNGAFIVADANAWADWILLFPVIDIAARQGAELRRDLVPVILLGPFWLTLKTIGLEYIFSHGLSISGNAYLWVRRTGVAEVTLMLGNAFRIFMQSYVYAIPAGLLAASWWIVQKNAGSEIRNPKYLAYSLLIASTVIVGISLSRSFWIGGFVGVITLLGLLSIQKIPWWKNIIGPISAGILGLCVIATTLWFPIPRVELTSLGALFASRTDSGEAAAKSRWKLLPVLWEKIQEHPLLGSGFGATVTYETFDPRIRSQQANGTYTTYAFEWGWLEHWIKFGIIGIPLMGYLVWSLMRRLWRSREPLWIRAGAVASLAAVAALHFFTPYLNHPLGFLFVFFGEAMLLSQAPDLQDG